MAQPPPYPNRGDDPGAARGSSTGPPRWMAVVGITIAFGLFALLILLHLTGSMGPGAH